MTIKILLALGGIALAAFFIANRRKARAKAGVKIGFLLFVLLGFWAVLRPDDLTLVANTLGVQRGSDLLLYVTVMAFLFVTVSTYVRFREQELRYARLARAVALQNAVRPDDDPPLSGGAAGTDPDPDPGTSADPGPGPDPDPGADQPRK